MYEGSQEILLALNRFIIFLSNYFKTIQDILYKGK